jgi:phage terminase small subunit
LSAAADIRYEALTERQRRFAEHYARTGNGAESCRLAGYANKAARIAAQQVLSNSNVVALVDELRKERLNALGVRPDRVLEELAASAFVDPKDVFDENDDVLPVRRMPHRVRRAIKKIRVREHYDKKTGEQIGRDIDIEFNDKLRANEILGRHLGILKETPIQVNQQNVFAAIVERAQGTSLIPAILRDEDDAANNLDEANTIQGEIIEKIDAPSRTMASDDALSAFRDIDDGDGDDTEDDTSVVEATPVDDDEAQRTVPESERRAFKSLWRGRRRRSPI